ncbi:hypothetical protein [Salibacterium aidingense]|uniref:hypothetical protein n=1 Tax=Salibacterium aidingense TaxID=384933 RepID=UPI003BD68996
MPDKHTQITLTVKHDANVDMAALTDKLTDYIFAEEPNVHRVDEAVKDVKEGE